MTATTGSRDIVRRAGARPASTAAASERRELWRAEHLSVPGTGHIHFTALPSDDDLAAQLARRVAADPSDARLHVARVNHHVVDGTPDGTFAALVDVFFAFGAFGPCCKQPSTAACDRSRACPGLPARCSPTASPAAPTSSAR